MASVPATPNKRRSMIFAAVYAGKDRWATFALVLDCHARELLGRHLSRSGKATTTASVLEHALIARLRTLALVETPLLLRRVNGFIFMLRQNTRFVRSYGLRQVFITPTARSRAG